MTNEEVIRKLRDIRVSNADLWTAAHADWKVNLHQQVDQVVTDLIAHFQRQQVRDPADQGSSASVTQEA